MRLLIFTQAVDSHDQALGFFHRWIEEFSKTNEKVHVVCLKEGEHTLPANVFVHSLGKEKHVSRAAYVRGVYSYAWVLRDEYDAVFVHMNQEYVLLAGFFWRALGKKVVLWRNHAAGSFATRIASMIAHKVCYTSPSAYVASYKNAMQMPLGIDTEKFTLPSVPPPEDSILFFGRLDPVKRPEIFIDALKLLQKRASFKAHIYGEPSRSSAYGESLAARAKELVDAGILTFHKAVPHSEAPRVFQSHAIYVNLTPPGSFDKTIGEAAASGCIPVVANSALEGVSPYVVANPSPGTVAASLQEVLALKSEQRVGEQVRLRSWVSGQSLEALMQKLPPLFV